jgi:hypothetical protein
LVRERVRIILDASVPEKTVSTDLSDGPPVFGRFSVAQRRLARVSLNLTKQALNNLSPERDMEAILSDALAAQQEQEGRRRGRRGRRGAAERRERIDYSSPEYAGLPHRGRVPEAEKEYVRNNLEAVNDKRRAQGHDPIDPSDPRQAERYGLTASQSP